ncbi:hypothetical protein D4R51_03010 [bacterium]|nr:MAG: hypothetical protein D4R51_03010 [bacterium]
MKTAKWLLELFILFILFKLLGAIPAMIIAIATYFISEWIEKKIFRYKEKRRELKKNKESKNS